MKPYHRLLLLALFIVISTGCASSAATATPEWQTYTNSEAGFSIRYPSTWKSETLPDQNSGALHGVSLTGTEGGVASTVKVQVSVTPLVRFRPSIASTVQV